MTNFLGKFTLYLVLFICITWGALIFLGPKLVAFLIQSKYGESVKIYNLKVTPQLKLLAARVELLDAEIIKGIPVTGLLRSVELNPIGLKDLKPSIEYVSGPVIIDNIGSAQSLHFMAKALHPLSFNLFNFQFELSKLSGGDGLSIEDMKLSGLFDLERKRVENLNYKINEIVDTKANRFDFLELGGTITNWGLSSFPERFYAFSSDLKFLSNKISVKNFELSVEPLTGLQKVTVLVDEISDDENNYRANDITANAILSMPSLDSVESVQLKIKSFNSLKNSYYSGKAMVTNLDGKFSKKTTDSFDVLVDGHLEKFDLKFEDDFLADLSGTKFNLNSTVYPFNPKQTFNSHFKIVTDSGPEVQLASEIIIDFEKSGFPGCFFSECSFKNFKANYEVSINSEILRGVSSCPGLNCGDVAAKHSLITLNTNNFFTNASNSKIFNPIVLGMIFSSFLSGKTNGSGHLLEF